MQISLVMKTARSATFLLDDDGIYHTKKEYKILLNNKEIKTTDTVVTSVFDLKPDTDYEIKVTHAEEVVAAAEFTTDYEYVTLDVKKFGAKGDGISDDTGFIQAAIMACPPKSRVLIPKGVYKITNIFLKSGLNLEIAKGAELKAETDRDRFAKFPGLIESYDEMEEYNLGTWEGNPLPMFAGIITGIGVRDINLYGEGSINGCANHENWWKNEKVMVGAFRPRMLFLNHCENVNVQGLYFHDSPAWVIHPYFSNQLRFCDLLVENPKQSPNTDGLDPESCKNVEILGVHFSLGDDCIAVKSGKIYMGRKYKTPAENTHICHCLMENGHGAVTVGSEIGGVKNMLVEKCCFSHTDRGLRIKTRRGRGKDSVLDGITFRDIEMDHVMTPFTANAFYFCNPDGRTEYVQSRACYPVDERTPEMRKFCFENIKAENCHVAAAYFDGLPESKIESITMKNVEISFAKEAEMGVPIMSNGVEPCSKKGIYVHNVEKLVLDHVQVTGADGAPVEAVDVDEMIQK